ncbi:cell division protein FtsQ/DivIB [Streptantibioticus ferralitis]|uniref:Cell division protein FtsQ n=1 Tax=Streptantibioticus ferralitis TaxID=236510 RepID=A0ABT5YZM9_9ACTN|nr:FtsQ-type POTRA domain-containing protein [Streptantibioticus ferralitis]MDF2257063.1 FtsQ-type POTRA domain-containing protein [Streptantibioticus ferralitis]
MAGPTTADRERARPARPHPAVRRPPRPRLSRRGVLVLLVAATLLVGGGTYLFYGSPWLRVRQVGVSGTRVLSADQVRAVAAVRIGTPLVSVDTGAVADQLRTGLPRIASIDVERSWPDKIVLKVTERTPKVLLKKGGKFQEVDVSGVRFATDSTPPSGVPIVELAGDAASSDQSQMPSNRYFGTDRLLRATVQVAMDLPESVQKQTQTIQVRSFDAISLELTGGRTVLWGSAEHGARKAAALTALMKAAGSAAHYDVSAPTAPASSGS